MLRRRVLWIAAGVTALTIVVGLVFRAVIDLSSGWLLVSLASLLIVFWLADANLEMNHAPDGEIPAPYIGLPNTITILRGVVVAWTAGFIVLDPQLLVTSPMIGDGRAWLLTWLPAACYGTVVTMDLADGSLARRRGSVTALGARLDAEYDGLGILAGVTVGIIGGAIPRMYLAAGLARYAFLAACRRREARGLPTFELPDSRTRRVLAGAQMAFVLAALSPAVGPSIATVGAVVVGVPFLTGFVRDWLYVSGRLR